MNAQPLGSDTIWDGWEGVEVHSWSSILHQRAWFTSLTLHSLVHATYLVGSGSCHSLTNSVLGVFQYISKVLGCSATMDYTFTNSLSWAPLKDSSRATVPGLSCSLWPLYVFKINVTWVTHTHQHVLLVARYTTFWHQDQIFCLFTLGKYFPEIFILMVFVSS